MRAIDLYAGVGGWAVGLKLAGVDVVTSYEWWKAAAETHEKNLGGRVVQADVRKLDLSSLPEDIDIVVGSPPCTQFSYSNRGGSGDIADGLKDIYAFLRVVKHVKPKHWAFENVPRVAHVIRAAIETNGPLDEFKDLLKNCSIVTVNMADYGIPQTRKRCIVGNFAADELLALKGRLSSPSLGEVLSCVSQGRDPNYKTPQGIKITDNDPEPILSDEEKRFNFEMKTHHPIYNGMSFPDRLDRPARTITATCTRVSRESIVVQSEGGFRRLTVRERASAQSFPISYQFHGSSYSEKLKMVGNAIPPIFTYLMGSIFIGDICPQPTSKLDPNAFVNDQPAKPVPSDQQGKKYPQTRRFRFSIPNLRFKSGTRFELSNDANAEDWSVKFFFGDSKRIVRVDINRALKESLENQTDGDRLFKVARLAIPDQVKLTTGIALQGVWNRTAEGLHPFEVLDRLGVAARAVDEELRSLDRFDEFLGVTREACLLAGGGVGMNKIEKNIETITAGFIVATTFNSSLERA